MFATGCPEGARPLAIVREGKSDGQIISIVNDDDINSVMKRKPVRKIQCYDGHFEQLPDPLNTRIFYITGSSGSGKSTLAADYIYKYQQLMPKAKFYLFSKLDEDPAFDHLDPIRITIDENLVENAVELDEIEENSMVLFDDCDNCSDKDIQYALNKLKEQILELGRKKKISCIITSHLINGNAKGMTRIIMNEMQSFSFSPRAQSHYSINYILKFYFGLSKSQIAKIIDLSMTSPGSRWCTILRNYPQILICEHELIFLSELGKSN